MDNVPINQRWYQSHCKKCPYLVNDEIMKKLHCVRPVGEDCLAESLLVAGAIAVENYNAMVRKIYADRDKKIEDDKVVNELTKKRRAKIHKRRR